MPLKDRYASFMLRLQWMPNDHHPVWIASTQSTRTGELRRFPNLDALIQFLREEFGDAARQEVADGGNDTARLEVSEENEKGDRAAGRPNLPPRGREPAKE